MNLYQSLINNSIEYLNRPAIVTGSYQVDYGQLLNQIHKTIYRLAKQNAEPGDQLIISEQNRPNFFYFCFAASYLSLTLLPSPQLAPREKPHYTTPFHPCLLPAQPARNPKHRLLQLNSLNLSEESILYQARNIAQSMQLTEQSRILIAHSLTNINDLLLAIAALLKGATIILHEAKKPKEIFMEMYRQAATHVYLKENELKNWIHAPELIKLDYSSLKLIHSDHTMELIELMKEINRVIHCEWLLSYQHSQLAGPLTWLYPAYQWDHSTSVGRPASETKIHTVNSARQQLPCRAIGEIALQNPTLTGDRWFYTGDFGSVDENGFLYLQRNEAHYH